MMLSQQFDTCNMVCEERSNELNNFLFAEKKVEQVEQSSKYETILPAKDRLSHLDKCPFFRAFHQHKTVTSGHLDSSVYMFCMSHDSLTP